MTCIDDAVTGGLVTIFARIEPSASMLSTGKALGTLVLVVDARPRKANLEASW
jgi:hypothetical protein